MWKKEDVKTQGVPENSTTTVPVVLSSTTSGAARDTDSGLPISSRAAACISHGIRIKGEVTGSEDLFIDGHLEGKLNLGNSILTVGPNGEIKADIYAREVVVRGRVDGKIVGREKIQLWSTGTVAGDLQTERLTIEDGAVLRGKVEIETGKPIKTIEPRAAAAGASTSSLASAIPGSAAS
jgi:cytoskeletal protein CcmA (bactofilin family)